MVIIISDKLLRTSRIPSCDFLNCSKTFMAIMQFFENLMQSQIFSSKGHEPHYEDLHQSEDRAGAGCQNPQPVQVQSETTTDANKKYVHPVQHAIICNQHSRVTCRV